MEHPRAAPPYEPQPPFNPNYSNQPPPGSPSINSSQSVRPPQQSANFPPPQQSTNFPPSQPQLTTPYHPQPQPGNNNIYPSSMIPPVAQQQPRIYPSVPPPSTPQLPPPNSAAPVPNHHVPSSQPLLNSRPPMLPPMTGQPQQTTTTVSYPQQGQMPPTSYSSNSQNAAGYPQQPPGMNHVNNGYRSTTNQQMPMYPQPTIMGNHQSPVNNGPVYNTSSSSAPHRTNGYDDSHYLNQQQQQQQQMNSVTQQMGGMSVTQHGFNKMWGIDCVDLLKQRQVLPPFGVKPPEIRFQQDYLNNTNCSPEIFRCTLTKIPESKALLQKSRLPLGVLIHPFKDLTQLPVIQCSTIVRCKSCRTYINPFIYFVDSRRWKCNLCFRANDLPEEFQYDPITKTYGDPSRRPEVRSATIEFVAPADYMVRPPQAAVYLYLLDVTANAVDTGYLKVVCDTLLENLESIPGDARTQIGFITYDSSVHFYNLAEGLSQPAQMVVCDIDDIFIPCPDNLLVSLSRNMESIRNLLSQLPTKFNNSVETKSALGAALQAAYKLLSPIGGRITVFQSCLPSIGPGSLVNRETSTKSVKDLTSALNPSTDFYKKLAVECSSQYIAVDCFFIPNQYVDVASISCVSKYSGGCTYYFPNYHFVENPTQSVLFENAVHRYITRKIGFEAVMRVRCTRGMSIHTFHGNFFVRSTDLLSLPNCNPDAGFGMQVSIDENLTDFSTVCFQAAVLYTSSKGERRIRVHTLCLPVASNVNDIINSVDQQCVIGLLAKMAVDRSIQSSLPDSRECFINAVVDVLSAYLMTQKALPSLALVAPPVLTMLPVYIHAMLRSIGFRNDMKPRLDLRAHFMNEMKTMPLTTLIQAIYPDLYAIHDVENTSVAGEGDEEIPEFGVLHLCSDRIDAFGVYLLDMPDLILIYVCRSVSAKFCQDVLGVSSYGLLNEMYELPDLDNVSSMRIRNFVTYLQNNKPSCVPLRIFREDHKDRLLFINNLVEDRGESSVSYYEFLQQIKNLVK